MDKQDKLIARLFKDTLIVIFLSIFAEKLGLLIDGTLTGKFLGTEAIAAFGLTVPYQKFVMIFTLVMGLWLSVMLNQVAYVLAVFVITCRFHKKDCRPFDPKKQVEIYNPEDPAAHIGIRLCKKISTEFNYVNALKLNNLIIKI